MANDISVKIGVEGEAEYRRQLKQITQQSKELSSEMKAVTSAFDKNDASQEKLSAQAAVLSKQIDTQKQKVTLLNTQYDKHKTKQEELAKAVEEAKNKYGEESAEAQKASKEYDAQSTKVSNLKVNINNATAALNTMERQQSEVNTVLQNGAEATDGMNQSMDGMGDSGEDAVKAIAELNQQLTDLGVLAIKREVLDNISNAFQNLTSTAYSAAKELDEGYDTIITKTGATGDALANLQASADNIFADLPASMSDVGIAIGEVNTRFGQTGSTLEETSKSFIKFAEINETDLNSSIDETDKILTQFGLSAEDAGAFLDLLTVRGQETGKSVSTLMSELDANASTFKQLGFSLEESTNLLALFEANGVESSTAVRGLKTAVNQYAKEGMSAKEGLEQTIVAIQNATTDTEALTIAQGTFGTKGAQVMADGIRTGRINLEGLSESMYDYAGTVERTYETTLDPWDKMTVATNNLKSAGSDLVGEFFSVAEPAIDGVTDAVKSVTRTFKDLPSPAKKVVAVGGTAVALAGVAVPKVAKVVSTLKTLKTAADVSKAIDALTKAQKGAAAAAEVVTIAEEASATAKGATTTATVAGTVASEADAVAKGAEATATGTATIAQEGLNAAMAANPVGLLVTGIAALTAGLLVVAAVTQDDTSEIGQLTGAARDATNALNDSQAALESSMDSAAQSVNNASANASLAGDIVEELKQLNDAAGTSNGNTERMRVLVAELNQLYPDLALSIDEATGSLNMSNQQLEDYVSNMQQAAKAAAFKETFEQAYKGVVDATTEVIKAERQQEKLEKSLAQNEKDYQKALKLTEESVKNNADGTIEWNGVMRNSTDVLAEISDKQTELQKSYDDLSSEIDEQNAAIKTATEEAEAYQQKANELSTSQTELGTSAESANASLSAQGETLTELSEAQAAQINVTGQATDAWNNMSATSQEKAVEVANAVLSMQDAVTTSVQNQMDLFAQWEQAESMSTEQMLQNMQSQIEGVSNWEQNLVTLADAGINQGLLQYLAQMGPDGAAYVQTFVNMSSEELAQANSLWDQSMDIKGMTNKWGEELTQATGELAAGGAEAWTALGQEMGMAATESGAYVVQGLVDGLQEAKKNAESAGEDLGDSTLKSLNDSLGVHSPSTKTKQSGVNVDQGLQIGINQSRNLPVSAAASVATAVVARVRATIQPRAFTSIGYNVSAGLASGILSGRSAVISAAAAVAQDAINAATSKLQIKSPSRVFRQIGAYTAEGYVEGITAERATVSKSINDMLSFAQPDVVSGRYARSGGITEAGLYNALSRALEEHDRSVVINEKSFKRSLIGMGVQMA